MSDVKRTMLGTVIGILAVLIVIWTMPHYPLVPHGIVLPANGKRTPVTGNIKVYDQFSAPFSAQNVGAITVIYHTASQDAAAQNVFFTFASQLAGAAGGNGIQLKQFFYIPSNTTSGPAMYMRGNVILTP